MYPEGIESLSLEDNILVVRVNLCCAAIALLIFAFLIDPWSWTGWSVALAVAAGLIYLAREIDRVFYRIYRPVPQHDDEQRAGSPDPYISPFY